MGDQGTITVLGEIASSVSDLSNSLQTAQYSTLHEDPKNVADGLFAIAAGLESIASAFRELNYSLTTEKVGHALDGLARIRGPV